MHTIYSNINLFIVTNFTEETNIFEIVIDATAIKEFESTLSVETLVSEDSSVPIAWVESVTKSQRVRVQFISIIV